MHPHKAYTSHEYNETDVDIIITPVSRPVHQKRPLSHAPFSLVMLAQARKSFLGFFRTKKRVYCCRVNCRYACTLGGRVWPLDSRLAYAYSALSDVYRTAKN